MQGHILFSQRLRATGYSPIAKGCPKFPKVLRTKEPYQNIIKHHDPFEDGDYILISQLTSGIIGILILIFCPIMLTGDYWDPFGGPLPSKTPTSAEVLRPSAGETSKARRIIM